MAKKILFAASEAVPFIKTGGLADVVGTLPEYFDKEKYEIAVFLPKYACMKTSQGIEFKLNTTVRLAWRNQYAGVFEAENNGIKYYFIDNEFYFSAPTPYGDARGDIEKFAFFSRSVLTVLPLINFKPDIIHCHDWQSAMIPVYLHDEFKKQDFYKDIKTVLTIHNLKFQGIYSRDIVEDVLGISNSYFDSGIMEAYGNLNLLKGGLYYSDIITTVSDSYKEEIKTSFYGEGLENFIISRQDVLYGIVNGIDYKTLNPEDDKYVYAPFSVKNIVPKVENKKALLKEMGLPIKEGTMLVGIVSRLTDQKGFDLIDRVLEEMLNEDIQLVVLGTGEKKYEDCFKYFEAKYPDKIKVNLFYSEELSHKIYAGCDAFLMPSLFEPCGLSQLMSLRYGTLPVVRETGGLKDTVVPYNEAEGTGTGFSFKNYDAYEMLNTLRYARKVFDNKAEWNKIVKNAMNADFSWNASAKKYERLYDSIK
jgi:starch synthase